MAPLLLFISLAFVLSSLPTSLACPTSAKNGHKFRKCGFTGCRSVVSSSSVPVGPTNTPSATNLPTTTSVVSPIVTPPTPPAPSPPSSSSNIPVPTAPTGGSSNTAIQTYLQAHNTVRSQHGAAALTWSNELGAKAQQWANGCQFKHSGGSLGPYGENLAAGTGNFSFQNGMDLWAAEASDYDPNNPTYSHFTQVVWKGTTQVGCAVATCSGIFDAKYGPAQYYVCEYNPPGNVIGQFAQNVQV